MMRLTALLLCLLPVISYAADGKLGRLFLAPAERAALELARHNGTPPEKPVSVDQPPRQQAKIVAVPAAPQLVTVHGYVRRGDGRGTVWVNRRPLQEGDGTQELEVGRLREDAAQVQLRLPGSGRKVLLKPGQRYDPATGKVEDTVEIEPPSSRTGPATAAAAAGAIRH